MGEVIDRPVGASSTNIGTRPLKIIAGADGFGASLKDAMVVQLRSLGVEVEDLGVDSYYSAGAEVGKRVSSAYGDDSMETRGLVCCGTGVGVCIFANKFPGVYAATCLSTEEAANARSINNSNVLALSGMSTLPEAGVEILKTWLDTPFKAPCPASKSEPWNADICSFLEKSLGEMPHIGKREAIDENPKKSTDGTSSCTLCCLAKSREFAPVDIMPGGSMKIVRETPTSAIVRFKAGSLEPAHHHTFGHDIVVMNGKKSVWNLTKKEKYDLTNGDYLFTSAGDVHRVKYHEDTEFFITWDGHWDIFLDEDIETTKKAIEEEMVKGSA